MGPPPAKKARGRTKASSARAPAIQPVQTALMGVAAHGASASSFSSVAKKVSFPPLWRNGYLMPSE